MYLSACVARNRYNGKRRGYSGPMAERVQSGSWQLARFDSWQTVAQLGHAVTRSAAMYIIIW